MKEDWYRVSFDLGIPHETEFPKEWPAFFKWLTSGAEPIKTIGDLVVVPGLARDLEGRKIWWCEGTRRVYAESMGCPSEYEKCGWYVLSPVGVE